jgi:hypothetical protein
MSAMDALLAIVGNERCSPVLLAYEFEIVNEIQSVVQNQSNQIAAMKQEGANLDQIQHKFCQAMELEVLRWKYVLQVYHSIRFKKIQALVGSMSLPTEAKLSDPETAFAVSLAQAVRTALGCEDTAFKEEVENLSAFVFFRPLDDIGSTLLSDSATDEAVSLRRGQIYFARFAHVRPFLDDRRAVLV